MRIASYAAAVAVALSVAAPASAGAATMTGDAAAWARAIHVHAPGPSGPPIEIDLGPCPGLPDAGGCSMPWAGRIYLLNRDPFTLEHELGHFYDARDLDDKERAWLLPLLGARDDTPWDRPDRWTDGDPYCLHTVCANERFADAYAACALDLHPGRWIAPHGQHQYTGSWIPSWHITRAQHIDLCEALPLFADPAPAPTASA